MIRDTSTISVLVVDNNRLVRKSLRALLSTYKDIHVVSEAEDGSQALQLAAELEPDVMLLDLAMPGQDGLEVLQEMTDWQNAPQVIICSFWEHLEEPALAAGAAAFIAKRSLGEQLVATIRSLGRSEQPRRG